MPTAELEAAQAFRDAVTAAVQEAAPEEADELLDSVRFLESLDPLTEMDPDDPDFAEQVAEAVRAHMGGGEHVFEDGTCKTCGY